MPTDAAATPPPRPDPGRDTWRATARAKAIASTPERRERFATSSGIEIADLYTPADVAGLDEDRDLGRPGEYPFTRGVQPTMYRGRLWTMRQYAGFATAAETNERFRYLLAQGQTGLSVAFDLPTQMGYDSDAPEAEGEVGRVGVPICSLADMEALFAGIPLGEVSTSMTINATAAILLALYVAAAEKQGVPRGRISRHDPERHPQGVHRTRDLHLPAAPVDAPRHRHLRVLRARAAALEHDQHLRLPHARGRRDGRPGAGLHAGRRDRVRRGGGRARAGRRCVRRPAQLLLRRLERALRGGREVPGRAPDVGAPRPRPIRGNQRTVDDVPLPRPDGRQLPDRPVDRQQRRPDHGPGPRGGPGRRPEPPHERARRGARAADRGGRSARPADAADPGLRGRGHRDPGPARRQLLRRVADGPAGDGIAGAPRRDRRAGWHARGHRRWLPAASDPGIGVPGSAGDRRWEPGRGRRQSVPRRRPPDAGAPAHRPGRRASTGGGAAARFARSGTRRRGRRRSDGWGTPPAGTTT